MSRAEVATWKPGEVLLLSGKLLTGRDASGVYGLQMFSVRREQGRLAELAPVIRVLAGRADRDGPWRAGLAALESRFPNGHPDLAAAWLTFGDLLRQNGRPTEARPLIEKAVAWRATHFGAADPRTADAERVLKRSKP